MNMSDDAFARLVAEEVKNKVSRSQRQVLLEKENWSRWRRSLVALVEVLQGQLDMIAEDEEADRDRYEGLGADGKRLLSMAMNEYEQRRKKVERFKFHVERRLDEVEQMISTGLIPEDEPGRHAVLYENAIRKHKELIETNDIEPTVIDLALWDALDGQWTFNNIRQDQII